MLTSIPLRHIDHRHEPPVAAQPIKIIHHDKALGLLVVNKPWGIVSSLDI